MGIDLEKLYKEGAISKEMYEEFSEGKDKEDKEEDK